MNPERGYFKGVEDHTGKEIRNYYSYVLRLQEDKSKGDFLEQCFLTLRNSERILEVFDVNWVEDGEYEPGIMDAKLYSIVHEYLEDYYRENELISAECYYSQKEGVYVPLRVAMLDKNYEYNGEIIDFEFDNPEDLFKKEQDFNYIQNFRDEAYRFLNED